MRSAATIVAVFVAAVFLVFCGDDKNGDGAESGYKLELEGIASKVALDTTLNISVQIMAGNKLITKGDSAQAKVSLLIVCGDNEIAKQEKAAVEGKASFAAIKVEGDNFKGDCTATASAKLAGKDVSAAHEFTVSLHTVVTLPDKKPTNGDEEYVPPTADEPVPVGRPFDIPSAVDLKVQPNDLCKDKDGHNRLALIYYDASNNRVSAVLTAGETIKAGDGVVSGLAVVKLDPGLDIATCISEGSSVPSITLAVSPKFPKGLRLKIVVADNPPSLTPPNTSTPLSSDSDKIKLSWEKDKLKGFANGAEIFFNNVTEGNEWTRYSGTPNWGESGSATSTLAYDLPVKALVRVKLSSGGMHWLYFDNTN